MPRPYTVYPPELAGALLPTGHTFFLDTPGTAKRLAAAPADDPWTILGRALLAAQAGEFAPLAGLDAAVADFPYDDFAEGCVVLLGFAAPRPLLLDLADAESLRQSGGRGLPAAYRLRALTFTHALWAARHVLLHLDSVPDPEARSDLIRRCSRIVDAADPGVTGNDTSLRAEARRLTMAVADLASALGTDAPALLKGRLLSLGDVVGWMMMLIRSASIADFAHYRMIFEAYTGLDCRRFYVEHHLQKLAAAAVLDEFLESGEAASFEPGVRYFFSHRIPD